ncbi:hypothetical protein A0256_15660 [Mucilaginibacter sp. PAMC 26640]|nr:hypothetical protein A0256_15660 [Mucilaginibacter sp. PAMC 26640]
MKTFVVSLLILLGLQSTSFAQYAFDIKDKTMAYARGYEKAAKSTPVEPSSQYLSGADVGQPLIYRRKENLLPDLLVYYFPNTKDSTINSILYEWDESNFTKNHQAITQPIEKLSPYIDRYLVLKKQAEAIFGTSETGGSANDAALIETGRFKLKDGFLKDGVTVEMYVVLSNKQETNGIVSILPTHRIRMYVSTAVVE